LCARATRAERLWIGPAISARSPTALFDNNITHLIAANGTTVLLPPHIKVKVVDVEDHHEEDILEHFDACVEFIDEGRRAGGVLVYCTAGDAGYVLSDVPSLVGYVPLRAVSSSLSASVTVHPIVLVSRTRICA
jgi:hypothetical protein